MQEDEKNISEVSNLNQDKFLFSLLKGVRNVFILCIISKHKIHGYALISLLNEATSSIHKKSKIHGSTIYPILHKLQEDGLIKSEEELNGKKKVKVYSITEEGLLALESIKRLIRDDPEENIMLMFVEDMIFDEDNFKNKGVEY